MDTTKIYLVENIEPNTNKVYIGKTKNDRSSGHKSTYGLQIKYTVIDEIDSLNHDDWEPLETYWIEQFKQWGFNVVNKRNKGGSGPINHTDETKQKISKGKKGQHYGEERNKKISIALHNHSQHYTEDVIQKMKKAKPEGFGKMISEANTGKSRPDIKGRISPNKGKPSPNKGVHMPKPLGFGNHMFKSIIQYTLDGNIIREWISIKEAKLSTNIMNIPLALSGANKSAGGFIWKYKI